MRILARGVWWIGDNILRGEQFTTYQDHPYRLDEQGKPIQVPRENLRLMRITYVGRHNKYAPHQGKKECARRLRTNCDSTRYAPALRAAA